MTRDEIWTESSHKICAALNEIFPGIPATPSPNYILTFDDEAVRIEMAGNDNFDGFFEVANENNSTGSAWGVKSAIAILIPEIYKARKQRVLSKLR